MCVRVYFHMIPVIIHRIRVNILYLFYQMLVCLMAFEPAFLCKNEPLIHILRDLF